MQDLRQQICQEKASTHHTVYETVTAWLYALSVALRPGSSPENLWQQDCHINVIWTRRLSAVAHSDNSSYGSKRSCLSAPKPSSSIINPINQLTIVNGLVN